MPSKFIVANYKTLLTDFVEVWDKVNEQKRYDGQYDLYSIYDLYFLIPYWLYAALRFRKQLPKEIVERIMYNMKDFSIGYMRDSKGRILRNCTVGESVICDINKHAEGKGTFRLIVILRKYIFKIKLKEITRGKKRKLAMLYE